MITYKGQKTVIGKRFIYEGEVLKYTGKIYGDNYNFVNSSGVEYILSESDLASLDEYEMSEADSNSVKNLDSTGKLKEAIINYTEQELAIINDLLAGKKTNIKELNDLYQQELDKLMPLNKYDMPKPKSGISLEAQKSYLDELNRNVSPANIPGLLASLQNFIESNKEGDENGNT